MTERKVPPRWLDCPRKGKLLAGEVKGGGIVPFGEDVTVICRQVSAIQNSS